MIPNKWDLQKEILVQPLGDNFLTIMLMQWEKGLLYAVVTLHHLQGSPTGKLFKLESVTPFNYSVFWFS